MLDFRFVRDSDTSDSTVECYFIISPAYLPGSKIKGAKRSTSPTRQCCYDLTRRNSNLLTGRDYRDGSLWAFHPFVSTNLHEEWDLSPKRSCCLDEDLCKLYYRVRRKSTCRRYRFPFWNWNFGDPHIRTIDGRTFVFNGIGEYWMIKDVDFQFQIRTIKGWNNDLEKKDIDATIFGALAVHYKNDARVAVVLDSYRKSNKSFIARHIIYNSYY